MAGRPGSDGPNELRRETCGAAETHALGAQLGRALLDQARSGAVVLLQGALGSGKTVFARGLAAGLGLADPSEVVSPSFILISEHDLPGGRRFLHVDLYRLGGPEELEGIGLREILYGEGGGYAAVEWGERLAAWGWGASLDPASRRPWIGVLIEDLGGERRRLTLRGAPVLSGQG